MEISIDYIAWYGAAVATFVLFWDMYKWIASGPKLKLHLSPNMRSIGKELGGVDTIFVEVNNLGNSDTTITKLIVKRYKRRFDPLLRIKPISQGVIMDSIWGENLPFLIKQGARWTGGINQVDLIKKTGREGVLYCGVFYTHSKTAKLKYLNMSELG